MTKRTKEVISGIFLLISLMVLVCLCTLEYSTTIGYAILIMLGVFLTSLIALATFSPSGWRLEGDEWEWALAAATYLAVLLKYSAEGPDEQERKKREEQRRDVEYYRNRTN